MITKWMTRAERIGVPTTGESAPVELWRLGRRGGAVILDGGVYIIRDGAGNIVYVGYTRRQVSVRLMERTGEWAKHADDKTWTVTVQDGDECLELALIWLHRPRFNVIGLDPTELGALEIYGALLNNQPARARPLAPQDRRHRA